MERIALCSIELLRIAVVGKTIVLKMGCQKRFERYTLTIEREVT